MRTTGVPVLGEFCAAARTSDAETAPPIPADLDSLTGNPGSTWTPGRVDTQQTNRLVHYDTLVDALWSRRTTLSDSCTRS